MTIKTELLSSEQELDTNNLASVEWTVAWVLRLLTKDYQGKRVRVTVEALPPAQK